jgi:hypothetical protein
MLPIGSVDALTWAAPGVAGRRISNLPAGGASRSDVDVRRYTVGPARIPRPEGPDRASSVGNTAGHTWLIGGASIVPMPSRLMAARDIIPAARFILAGWARGVVGSCPSCRRRLTGSLVALRINSPVLVTPSGGVTVRRPGSCGSSDRQRHLDRRDNQQAH